MTTLAKKLAEVMAAIDHVEKSGRNESQKYNYVKAADVAHAVRGKLAEKKIVMMPVMVQADNHAYQVDKDGIVRHWNQTDVTVTYRFIDGESGETLDIQSCGTGLDTGDKASYKSLTGALKYALRMAFLIPDESDPEADESVDEPQGKPQSAPQERPKSPPSANTGHSNDISGVVEAALVKPVKGGKRRVGILVKGTWYGSFDEEYVKKLDGSKGKRVDFTAIQDGAFWNIDQLIAVDGVEVGGPF